MTSLRSRHCAVCSPRRSSSGAAAPAPRRLLHDASKPRRCFGTNRWTWRVNGDTTGNNSGISWELIHGVLNGNLKQKPWLYHVLSIKWSGCFSIYCNHPNETLRLPRRGRICPTMVLLWPFWWIWCQKQSAVFGLELPHGFGWNQNNVGNYCKLKTIINDPQNHHK